MVQTEQFHLEKMSFNEEVIYFTYIDVQNYIILARKE